MWRVFDAVMLGTIGLLAAAAVGMSLIFGEASLVVVSAMFLTGAIMVLGCWSLLVRLHTRRRLIPVLLVTTLGLTIVASVAITHWPLRAGYAMSHAALNALAGQVAGGGQLTTPQRAGWFTIERAETSRDGIVCLWTDIGRNGKTGFVQCSPDDVPVSLWTMIRLDDRWQFVAED